MLQGLEKKANAQLEHDGVAAQRRRFHFSLDMRHRGQINEVEVPLPEKRVKGAFEETLRRRFSVRYEQLYGRGSSYGEARQEIVTLRLRASAATPRPRLAKIARRAQIGARAALGKRSIYWAELKRSTPTPVYDGALLVSGNRITGPAVVETTDTTVVVHPGRSLQVDALGNFEIVFRKRAGE
jgi:N-methylhydantoinase A